MKLSPYTTVSIYPLLLPPITYITYHSLVFRLEGKNILRQFLPGLSETRMNMVHDMLKTSIELRLRCSRRVKVADAIRSAVHVSSLQGVEAMHADQELIMRQFASRARECEGFTLIPKSWESSMKSSSRFKTVSL